MNIQEIDTHEAKLLVIGNEEDADGFARKMIGCVRDPLFLPTAGPSAKAYSGDGFGYEISGLVPLPDALKNRALSLEEITAMVIRLGNAILVLEAHMLGDENLLLSPEHVYVRPGSADVTFCPAFSAQESFEERLRPLIREIFLHADAEEPRTLRLASELFKVSLRKHYRMHDLLEVLESGARPAEDGLPEPVLPEPAAPQPAFLKPAAPPFAFEEWPDEAENASSGDEARGGLFGKMKEMAAAAVAWVRGDDQIESTSMIRFEDHT